MNLDLARMLSDIHHQSFPAHHAWSQTGFLKFIEQEAVDVHVHEKSGFIMTQLVEDEMEILTLAVLPNKRRQGIATKLIQQGLEPLKKTKGRCFLEVDKHNVAALKLYERLDFKPISMRKGYYRTPAGAIDAYVMEKNFSKK